MNKKTKIVGLVFTLMGVVVFVTGLIVLRSTQSFLKNSFSTTGTVIELSLRRTNDPEMSSTRTSAGTYYPIVQFKTEQGEEIEFVSNFSSNPPIYRVGQEVEVLYNFQNPYDAKIKSFLSLWLLPIISLGLGLIFAITGTCLLIFPIFSAKKQAWLKTHGQKISAEIMEVRLDNSVRINSRSPFRIYSQWQDPNTKKVHIFKSSAIWFDPQSFLKTKRIDVFIDPQNPKKYFVDISFLPETAD